MASKIITTLMLAMSTLFIGTSKGQIPVAPGLSYTFYETSCPQVEFIIRARLWDVFSNDITQAAGLLRLHFHDCFVQGCDASVLLDGSTSGPSEQDAPPNLTLRSEAFAIIEDLRARVHNACGPIVSCADIVALAARESVFLPEGPFYPIPLGRKDGVNFATRTTTLANLPPPTFNTTQLINSFGTKNLTITDLVALSGGHTIGRGHCTSFANRLYPNQDPTMNQTFADGLKLTCPTNTTFNTTSLDILSPNWFDNKYFVDLVNSQGLFTSDQDLYTDSRTKDIVISFAQNQTLFFEKFVEGMIKMGQLGVLTGSQGEIRTNCSAINNNDVQLNSNKIHRHGEHELLTGGRNYNIPLGRRDSVNFATQSVTLANLPAPFSDATTILNVLALKKFDATDAVALSGGHSMGRGHCTSFTSRLYPKQDATMDPGFAKNLKLTCPKSSTDNTTNLDIRSPNVFDNKYYIDLVNRQGLFTSDQDLFSNSKTKGIVTSFANNQSLFFEKFVNAMIKMGQIGVLTGTQGEIRASCSARNVKKVEFIEIEKKRFGKLKNSHSLD